MKDKEFVKFYKDEIENIDWVKKFENELKLKFNSKYAVACSSGTAAIHCALLALGIKCGDEVIVPNLTVIMTIMPLLYIGAVPVFVDCDKDNIDFDYNDLETKITDKTKAIIPVYMWGLPYDIPKLNNIAKKYKLKIIEDACQAQGSRYKNKYLGTFGEMGCFSLKDGKLVSAGEGGYILTNNKKYYTKLVNLRNHQISQNPDNSFKDVGYNYRLTNIQAYLALESLNNIDANLSHRKHICNKFYKEISCVDNLSKLQCNSNYFSPLLLLKNNSLENIKSLSKKKVINSVGSFGLRPVTERIAIKRYLKSINYNHRIKVTNCKILLNRLLAIAINNNYNDIKVNTDIREIKGVINE